MTKTLRTTIVGRRILQFLVPLAVACGIPGCKQRTARGLKSPVAASADSAIAQKVATDYDMVLNFAGKGTAVVWDLGVAQGLFSHIKALQANRAIFTGNSSGSFMAAYFSCFGLSE